MPDGALSGGVARGVEDEAVGEIPVGLPVAFLTGAGGGIGRATALVLAQTHRLILTDGDPVSLSETAALVRGAGGTAHPLLSDVTSFPQVQSAVRAGEAALGEVSAAVACAGVEVLGTADTVTLAGWERSLAVNLTGVFHVARATIGSLRRTRGSFTVIASDAATHASEDGIAYVAAKHGALGIVRSMALDHGPDGVRSNAVCPGFVETGMAVRIFADSPEGSEEHYRGLVPLGRFAQPEEVARTVKHLVESTYVNGAVYALDGGATAGYFARPARV